jgi:hypothetical protein
MRPGSENRGIKQDRHCDLLRSLCTDACWKRLLLPPFLCINVYACTSLIPVMRYLSTAGKIYMLSEYAVFVTFLIHRNLTNLLTILKTLNTSFIHYCMALLDGVQFQCNFLCLQLKLIILRN